MCFRSTEYKGEQGQARLAADKHSGRACLRSVRRLCRIHAEPDMKGRGAPSSEGRQSAAAGITKERMRRRQTDQSYRGSLHRACHTSSACQGSRRHRPSPALRGARDARLPHRLRGPLIRPLHRRRRRSAGSGHGGLWPWSRGVLFFAPAVVVSISHRPNRRTGKRRLITAVDASSQLRLHCRGEKGALRRAGGRTLLRARQRRPDASPLGPRAGAVDGAQHSLFFGRTRRL